MLQCQEHLQSFVPTTELSGRVAISEKLWQDFYSGYSDLLDNRVTKKTPKHQNLTYKATREDRWVDCGWNSHGLKTNIANMGSDHKQISSQSRTAKSTSSVDEVKQLCQDGLLKEALHKVKQMIQQTNVAPTVAFTSLLKGCARRKALAEGKQVHALLIQSTCGWSIFLANNLIDMYAKCGSLVDACKVFNTMPQRNVFSWTAIISAYVDFGKCDEAIYLFQQLLETDIPPDEVVFVVVLKACARIAALKMGKQFHSEIMKRGFDSNVIVQGALLDMYAKCGSLQDARELFNSMKEINLVSWTAIIGGYVENRRGKEALALYEQMKREGVQPDKVTFLVALKACASIGALEQGEEIHLDIRQRGFESDMIVKSTLIDMYAKCGSLEDARNLFISMSERSVVSWNVMIGGYGQNGLGREALALYEQMKQEGVRPDEVTFISVLSACNHSGLIDEGRHVFDSMIKDYSFTPTLEHYTCVVDLLCRVGCLEYAEDLIRKLPVQPDGALWMSLLGAAKNYGHVEIGRRAFDFVVQLEPSNPAPYLLLIDIYSSIGRIDEVEKLAKEMIDKGLVKFPGYDCIRIGSEGNDYVAGDASYPHDQQIQAISFSCMDNS